MGLVEEKRLEPTPNAEGDNRTPNHDKGDGDGGMHAAEGLNHRHTSTQTSPAPVTQSTSPPHCSDL